MAAEFQTSRIQIGRPAGLDSRWLLRLVEAMELAARPDVRNVPCDAGLISDVTAHLARPASAFAPWGSYSFRN